MAAQFSVINPLFEADDAHLTDIFDEETFEFVQCHGAEYADSSCYEGWWDGRQKEGFGAVGFVDGARFLGQFQSGLPQGLGLYITPKGSKYIGEFHKGAFQGFGRYINLDGARYEGQFSNGKAMGLGVLFYADGSKEEGYDCHSLGCFRYSNISCSSRSLDTPSGNFRERRWCAAWTQSLCN
eukprot:m.425418 g.425418  ORF g.425418 m.425418 type:complete len:182 (-) comp56683_c1_seq15:233-778(-)